jgi:hypothetical protein
MSDVLGNIKPWIASVVFDALTFDPDDRCSSRHDHNNTSCNDDNNSLHHHAHNKKQDRKTHLAQVLRPPQPVINNNKDKTLYRLFLSDGSHYIAAYIPNLTDNTTSLAKGSLVRLRCKHWTVSLTCLMGHYEEEPTNHEKEMEPLERNNRKSPPRHRPPRRDDDLFCLVLYKEELKYSSHWVMLDDDDDESSNETMQKSSGCGAITTTTSSSISSSRPCIECIGCEGMGIVGTPMDVHLDLDVRRALVAIPSRFQQCSQIIHCLNYTLERDGKDDGAGAAAAAAGDAMEGIFPTRYIPCGDLVSLASFELYPNKQCMKILSDLDDYFFKEIMVTQSLETSEKTFTNGSSKQNQVQTTQVHDNNNNDHDDHHAADMFMNQYFSTEDFVVDALGTQVEHHQGETTTTMMRLEDIELDGRWSRQDSPCGLSWSPSSSTHTRTPLSTQPTSVVRGVTAMLDDSSSQEQGEEGGGDDWNHDDMAGDRAMTWSQENVQPKGNFASIPHYDEEVNDNVVAHDDDDDDDDDDTCILGGNSQLETQQPYHDSISNGVLHDEKGLFGEDTQKEITRDLETQPVQDNVAIQMGHDGTFTQETSTSKKMNQKRKVDHESHAEEAQDTTNITAGSGSSTHPALNLVDKELVPNTQYPNDNDASNNASMGSSFTSLQTQSQPKKGGRSFSGSSTRPGLNPVDKELMPNPQYPNDNDATNNFSMGSSFSSLQTQSQPKKGGRSFSIGDLVRKKKRTLNEKRTSKNDEIKATTTTKKSVGSFGILNWMYE